MRKKILDINRDLLDNEYLSSSEKIEIMSHIYYVRRLVIATFQGTGKVNDEVIENYNNHLNLLSSLIESNINVFGIVISKILATVDIGDYEHYLHIDPNDIFRR